MNLLSFIVIETCMNKNVFFTFFSNRMRTNGQMTRKHNPTLIKVNGKQVSDLPDS